MCLLFDEEATQIQGLGQWLLMVHTPGDRLLGPCTDPSTIVQYIVKTCTIHYERYIGIVWLNMRNIFDSVLEILTNCPTTYLKM